jgi:hypothetical protein
VEASFFLPFLGYFFWHKRSNIKIISLAEIRNFSLLNQVLCSKILKIPILYVHRPKKTVGMGAARALKHRFFALFLVLLLGMQKKNKKKMQKAAQNPV